MWGRTFMAKSMTDGERVRQHVSKVLRRLRALRDRQRAGEIGGSSFDGAVEIERETDISRRIAGGEDPS
jgi:hypothetical protein